MIIIITTAELMWSCHFDTDKIRPTYLQVLSLLKKTTITSLTCTLPLHEIQPIIYKEISL